MTELDLEILVLEPVNEWEEPTAPMPPRFEDLFDCELGVDEVSG